MMCCLLALFAGWPLLLWRRATMRAAGPCACHAALDRRTWSQPRIVIPVGLAAGVAIAFAAEVAVFHAPICRALAPATAEAATPLHRTGH
jgi:hypothetical protein